MIYAIGMKKYQERLQENQKTFFAEIDPMQETLQKLIRQYIAVGEKTIEFLKNSKPEWRKKDGLLESDPLGELLLEELGVYGVKKLDSGKIFMCLPTAKCIHWGISGPAEDMLWLNDAIENIEINRYCWIGMDDYGALGANITAQVKFQDNTVIVEVRYSMVGFKLTKEEKEEMGQDEPFIPKSIVEIQNFFYL